MNNQKLLRKLRQMPELFDDTIKAKRIYRLILIVKDKVIKEQELNKDDTPPFWMMY